MPGTRVLGVYHPYPYTGRGRGGTGRFGGSTGVFGGMGMILGGTEVFFGGMGVFFGGGKGILGGGKGILGRAKGVRGGGELGGFGVAVIVRFIGDVSLFRESYSFRSVALEDFSRWRRR